MKRKAAWDLIVMKMTFLSKQSERLKIAYFQNPLPKGAEKRFHFSEFTITLNEEEERVAPTDSRHRKDQRLMEETKWDEANAEKQVW